MMKKFLCISLSLILTAAIALPVYADTESDLEAAKAANQNALSSTNSQLSDTQNAQTAIKSEITDMDSQLVTLMSNIDVLKGDISNTEQQISDKNTELAAAQQDYESQYKDMETRMSYIYENGGTDAVWMRYVLQAKSFTDMLNRADYTQQMEKYDREMLNQFLQTVQTVSDLKDSLESTKSDLEEEQQNLEEQQSDLTTRLEEKKATSADYDSDIANLQAQADALTESISEQNAQIVQIRQEKEAAAAAAAAQAQAAAEAAAAKEAAAQQAAVQAAVQTPAAAQTQETAAAETQSQQTASAAASSKQENETAAPAASSSDSSSSDSASITVPSGAASSSIGDAVVAYACQFVGNPYVWGGESLTNGCDCSGFVMQVFAHFGYDLPHSSGDLASVGVGVSYSEAQPGDIICYSGHVGIYIGGDTIVNASNEREGIKYTSPATYRTIVAVRRVG
ncbi:MAG: NlpC/P60 family protein [Lachnospiraceae bacterium]|jgi:cell wall-associated NlpC family hydrolase|nr:NlpC/P60 family protein [Lachnospiraceae bacterium]